MTMAEELEQPAEQVEQAEAVVEPGVEAQPDPNERFKWYILHAYSGFERKVRESIQSRVQAFGLSDRVPRDDPHRTGDGDRQRQKADG
jgi:transcriptional antiterminator NusG